MQIYLIALQRVELARWITHNLGRHVQYFFQHGCLVQQVAHSFRWFGLAQIGKQLTDLAQGVEVLAAHAQDYPFFGPEQVRQYRYRMSFGIFK